MEMEAYRDAPLGAICVGHVACDPKNSLLIAGLHAGGIVEDIGPNTTVDWKKGDRIAAFVHGGNNSQFDDGM